jgi:histidine ammonia-lyase
MKVRLDGKTLSSMEVLMVARSKASVEIANNAWAGIENSRAVIERILADDKTVYGINTGFGALANTRISADDMVQLQINLIRSHACALGEPMSIELTRAMMVIRANSLAKGCSGIQRKTLEQIIIYLNEGITPVVPRIGSLGASGDLAPLSHMALTLIGEGEVWSEEMKIPTSAALLEKGLIAIELGAKDGLSLINGTSQMCAFLSFSERMLADLLVMADLVACASIEARACSVMPHNRKVHESRPHPGQLLVARRIHTILANSPIVKAHGNSTRVQDPYSFRCIPQVHGAVLQSFNSLKSTLEIEINSATDNPLIFPDPRNPGAHEVISQGNFHGEILALSADAMSLAIFELASISERRIDQILDPARSGLPPFLARDSGLESGMMIVQYVAAASLGELNGHAAPRTAFSIPTSAGQEDHASMGATASANLLEACYHLSRVLACELLIACEALTHTSEEAANHVLVLHKLLRNIAEPLTGDRSTAQELEDIAECMRNGSWLARIEAECGRLPRD